MKAMDIVGENYFGKWTKSRTACRAVIMKDGMILLSYATKADVWMIPGGGIEDGESDEECCIREVAEETGIVVKVGECYLEINEYYEDCKYINRYFICEAVGECPVRLTEQEKSAGMVPRWIPLDEITEIFSRHADYAATDEMKRGMYQREYTALCEARSVISGQDK